MAMKAVGVIRGAEAGTVLVLVVAAIVVATERW